jgi:hypothetical protein
LCIHLIRDEHNVSKRLVYTEFAVMIEVLEEASRPLKRNRRRLKGIYPGM